MKSAPLNFRQIRWVFAGARERPADDRCLNRAGEGATRISRCVAENRDPFLRRDYPNAGRRRLSEPTNH
jgi:hypothetical protein